MTTNPALADLQFLAGAWDMELSEASFLPDPGRYGRRLRYLRVDRAGHGPGDAHE